MATRSRADAEPHRLAVVSPHLDDAVFGCGLLLASQPDAVVVTLFAGVPPAGTALPEWDAACGFGSARDAMVTRRREDQAALRLLGVRPCWLGCLDAQYRRSAEPDGLTTRLARALARLRPDVVAMPLGLFHDDHRLAHAAARALVDAGGDHGWLVYEDAIYRTIPGLVDARLAALAHAGLGLEELHAGAAAHRARKARAVACYASQLRGLASAGRPGHADAYRAERYWRLHRAGTRRG